MKLLFITPKIPYPPNDGHTKSMWGVIKYLSLLGHQIDIVCYRQNVDAAPLKSEIEKYAKLFVLDVQTGNSIMGAFKNLFSTVPYNFSKYNRPELKIFLKEYFQKEKVDLVHVVNAHMGWIIDFIREYSDVPIVLRQENLELMIMLRFTEAQKNIFLKIYSYIQFKKVLKYEPALCARFDKCIMMSDEDEAQLLKLNPNVKTKVIPLGIEKDLLNLEKKAAQPFSIAHIGSLKWFPNYDGFDWFVKEILPMVAAKIPETRLYVYGGGMPDNYLIPANVKNKIIIKGFVENIWDELADKSIAVIPLRIGSGIRVKILEMLAAGINILTTSIGCEGLGVADSKELLIADTAREFAEKIINLFEDKSGFGGLTEHGKEFIRQNYIWEKIVLEFESTYLGLIKK
jgi:glycosyltransferase involved in cell wall biosynthesis